ncbi:MAG TPA: glycosyltransferase family 2 protein [Candidatus Methanoperedens sp.]|nr:glycosyltransferase family 2 protein [Candidatus Methanoperedens sp.]
MSPKGRNAMTNFKIKKPLISVYMPVFNATPYLSQAIESVLNQTLTNFEFIIIDDHSTDDSWKIIKSYARRDSRIRIFRNRLNLGVSTNSNIAISLARCKYLARMDADDISVADRLEKQYRYLKKHPQTVVVGAQCTIINQNDQVVGFKNFPTSTTGIKDMLFWAVPIQQGYMMINRSLLPKSFSWYSATKTSAEEVDLYFKLSQFGNFANLPDNLYFYRQIDNSLSHLNPKKTFYLTLQSRLNAIKNGFKPSFKAIFINIAQIAVISILPSSFIYNLWYFIRGINQNQSQHQIGTFVESQV